MGKLVESEAEGTVRIYKSSKGYGFVHTLDIPDQVAASTDVFFHISDVPADSVEEGWRFKFRLMETKEGYRAKDIVISSKKTRQYEEEKRQHGLNKDEPLPEDRASPLMMELMQKNKEQDDDEKEEKKRSPFSDDIQGSKNDLIK